MDYRSRIGRLGPGIGTRDRAIVRAIDDPAVAQLHELLGGNTEAIRTLFSTVMAVVDARLAGATRMVYANGNATVVGYSADGKSRHSVCSVAAYARWVNLFFFVGPDLPDPHGLLNGSGSTVRSVRITSASDIDDRVTALLDAAIEMCPWEYDSSRPTTTVVAAISEKRRLRH